jgi:hypothetical protein
MNIPPPPAQPEKLEDYDFCRTKLEKSEKQNEFHKIFKSVPKCERLIRTFRCAIARPTLFDGKLWLSEHHICFKINWPSNSQYILDFTEIVDIRKASFANMIPNAIEIETTNQVYFIGSINSHRDQKFDEIWYLWGLHVDTQSLWRKFPSMKGLQCTCSFPELKTCDVCIKHIQINKDDPDGQRRLPNVLVEKKSIYLRPNNSDGLLNASRQSRIVSSPQLSIETSRDLLPKPEDERDEPPRGIFAKRANTTSRLPSPSSSRPSSPTPDDSVSQIPRHNSSVTLIDAECECKEEGYQMMHESVIQGSLPLIWKQWFSFNGDCLFVQYLQTIQKITDIKVTNWVASGRDVGEFVPVAEFRDPLEYKDIHEGFHRKSTRMIPLNHGLPFIPKQTTALNDFEVLHISENRLGVQNMANIVAIGIVTNLRYCFTQINESQTRMQLYGQIVFTGKGKFSVPPGIFV